MHRGDPGVVTKLLQDKNSVQNTTCFAVKMDRDITQPSIKRYLIDGYDDRIILNHLIKTSDSKHKCRINEVGFYKRAKTKLW